MNIATKAACVTSYAHAGQYRRDGVTSYLTHPAAVVNKLKDESELVLAVAWLHDVLEDTNETAESLRAKDIPEAVIHIVQILTKTESMSYEQYLKYIKQNEIARKVKIADMLHNLSDSPTNKQIVKYAKGLLFLLEE